MNIPHTIEFNYQTLLKTLQDKPEYNTISAYLYLQSILLCNNNSQIPFLSFYNFMDLPYDLSFHLFKALQSSKKKHDFLSNSDFISNLSILYSNTDISFKLNLAYVFLTLDCNSIIYKQDIKILLSLFHFIDNNENTFYEINEILDSIFESNIPYLPLEQFKSKCIRNTSILLLVIFFLDHYQPFSNETISYFIENIYNTKTFLQNNRISKEHHMKMLFIYKQTKINYNSYEYCYLFQYLYYNYDYKNLIIDKGIDDLNIFERSIHEIKDKMIEHKLLNPIEDNGKKELKSFFLYEPFMKNSSHNSNRFIQSKTLTTDISSRKNELSNVKLSKGVTFTSSYFMENSDKNKMKQYKGVLKRNKSIITESTNIDNVGSFKRNKTVYTDNNSGSGVYNKIRSNHMSNSEGSGITLKSGNSLSSTIDKNPLLNEVEFFVILKKKKNLKCNNISNNVINERNEDLFQFSKNKLRIVGNDLYIFRYDKKWDKYFFKQIISLKQLYIEEGLNDEQIFDVESKTIYYSIHLISTLQNKFQVNVIFVSDKSIVNKFIHSVQRITKFKTIHDKYELINLLGKGSNGIVMKAINKKRNFVVAVKIMEKDYNKIEQLAQIRREVDISKYVTKVNHSKLTRVIEIIETSNTLYIIEEYTNGKNLDVFIKKKLPYLDCDLKHKLILSIIEQLLQALTELKRIGVLHMNLNPENVLLNLSGMDNVSIKVIDYGTARIKLSNNHYFDLYGTMRYLAPEIIKREECTEKVDIWALGVLIYYLIYGKHIFQINDSNKNISNMILNLDIKIEKEMKMPKFKKIKEMLLACFNKNPKLRADIEHLIEIFNGT